MSYSNLFSNLPDTARLWIYVARNDVTPNVQTSIEEVLTSFFGSWDSHGRSVSADAAWHDNRFLFVAAHLTPPDQSISGCATDALVQTVDNAAQSYDVEWMPALSVAYRTANEAVAIAARNEFASLANEQTVDATTPVFDPSITTLGALRSGAFEEPAGSTWHARAFSLAQPA